MALGGRLLGSERIDTALCEPSPSVSGQQAGEIPITRLDYTSVKSKSMPVIVQP